MKKWIMTVAMLGSLAGCQSVAALFDRHNSVQNAKAESMKRWNHSRAQVLYGVACEHLKVGQLDQARLKAMEVLSLEENNTEARLLLARVLIEQGNYAQAAAEMTKAREKSPDSAGALYLLGVALEKDGKLEEALEVYRRAHVLDETNLDAVMAAGEVLVTMGQLREAQHQVESYMPLADNEPGMYELAGRLAMMNHEYAKAAQYLQQASDLDSRNVRYREALARARFRAGQQAETVQALNGLAECKSYKMPAWAHTMLGDCHMALGRPHNARIAYEAAAELTPESPGAWVNVAKAAMSAGDASRAIQSARRALQLEATDLDAAMILGYSLLRDGQTTRAISELTQATAAHPNSGMLHCLLGKAYAASGNGPEALRCYAAALKAEPDNRLARELIAASGGKEITKAN
jgi:tetratricopeptide (TPR) repeat protein